MESKIEKALSENIRLSVIIPAYNEATRIGRTLEAVNSYLNKQGYRSEIIVVDDGSSDKTGDVVDSCMSVMPRVRRVRGACNRGKGWAVREGMINAKGAFRLFMDADNSTSIDQWQKCAPLMEAGVHVVVGSRIAPSSEIRVSQPPLRRLLGAIFRAYVQTLFALAINDTQSGFKVFSAEAAEAVFSRLRTERWAFDVEVLAIAKLRGFEMREVPVDWANDIGSRMTPAQMVGMAADILKIRLRVRNYRSPQGGSARITETSKDIRDWRSFWNRPHSIYVDERHLDVHYRDIAQGIIALLPRREARVLDYGCGDAIHADCVAAASAKLILCDAASSVRQRLAQRFTGDPKISVLTPQDVERLPAQSIDFVIASSLVQYLAPADLDHLLGAWYRLLAPGGTLVVGDVIPPGVGPLTDAAALLRYGARNGFLVNAVVGLVRTTFSSYRKVRTRLGIATYSEMLFIQKLAGAGFVGERLPFNLGHNPARMMFLVRVPRKQGAAAG